MRVRWLSSVSVLAAALWLGLCVAAPSVVSAQSVVEVPGVSMVPVEVAVETETPTATSGAAATETPTPTPTPAPAPVLDTGPLGEAIGAALWGQLERYAQQSGPGMVLRGVLWLIGQGVKGLLAATGWASTVPTGLGTSPLLTSLPPIATYDAPLVQQAWGLVRGAAFAAWGVAASAVVCWLIARLTLGYV
ncbi:MAG: hypothetical protein ACRDI2_16410, partial [Chloroflexota bacterium]